MKKVLIVIGKLYIGGAEKVAYSIGKYADKYKYQIDYVVYGDEIGDYENELISEGCIIHHLPNPSNSYQNFLKALWELMKRERYEIIHSHTMFNSGWILIFAKFLHVPIRITHSHSIKGFQKRSAARKVYESVMQIVIQRLSTQCVACGQMAGEWLFGKHFFQKYGKVILNGVDVQQYKYNEDDRRIIRNQLALEGSFVIGHAGHLIDVKHQDFLISILPDLVDQNPKTKLLLLGDGQKRKEYEQLVTSLDVNKYVLMPGNVSDVGRYLSAMDVFAFPSRYEGTPLTLLEAQVNGLPCVISDKVPPDVCLTPLIHIEKLDDRDGWVDRISNLSRNANVDGYNLIADKHIEIHDMLKIIFEMYE